MFYTDNLNPIAFAAVFFIVSGIISLLLVFIQANMLYKYICTEDLAMKYYREQTNYSLTMRLVKITFILATILFGAYTILMYNKLDYEMQKKFCTVVAVSIVATIDVHVLSGLGEGLAKATIVAYVSEKFGIECPTVIEWNVETDEDDFPEEIELDMAERTRWRYFLIDLERHIIREKNINERTD